MEQSKNEKFSGPGGLNAGDIFASEETIHKLLDKVEAAEPRHKTDVLHSSVARIILVVNLVLVVAVLVYLTVFRPKPQVVVAPAPVAKAPAAAPAHETPATEEQAASASASLSKDPVAGTQYAQDLYQKGEYEKARACYAVLRGVFAGEGPQMRPLADYMEYKVALCQLRLNRQPEATRFLNECASSTSPLVAVMANYRLAVGDMHGDRFAAARMRLYNCLALIGACPEELQSSLERECSYLLAQTTVERFWQTTNVKPELPPSVLERPVIDDPAAKLGYEELMAFVGKGTELFAATPTVTQKEIPGEKVLSRWNVTARGANVYELLSDLGTKAAFGIKWEAPDADKMRTVNICVLERSPDQATEIIAGCAGLITGVKNGIPTISNPESAALRDQQKRIYSTEAIALLNRHIVLYPRDETTATAYFFIGLIHEQTGAQTAAISDYKIIASRYSASPLAQYALWNSAKIKLYLKDNAAARADLGQIMELNQDHAVYCQAAMKLAQLTWAEGMYKEADRLYRKVYAMNPTVEVQAAAALGAAQSLFAEENNFEASEWFNRYIQLERNKKSPELFEAAVDLGICYRRMDKNKQSGEALRFALARELTLEQRMKASIELARTEIGAESYVKALAALQNLPVTPNLTDDEITVLLLNSQINCEIGMPEKAALSLQNAIDRAFNKERASRLAGQLARAYIQMGSPDKAADMLTKVRDTLQPSAAFNEISCCLAEVDVELGRNTEAISLCTGLLSVKPGDEIMERAFRTIGKAYTNMKQYDKAALAYAGRISTDGGAGI